MWARVWAWPSLMDSEMVLVSSFSCTLSAPFRRPLMMSRGSSVGVEQMCRLSQVSLSIENLERRTGEGVKKDGDRDPLIYREASAHYLILNCRKLESGQEEKTWLWSRAKTRGLCFTNRWICCQLLIGNSRKFLTTFRGLQDVCPSYSSRRMTIKYEETRENDP